MTELATSLVDRGMSVTAIAGRGNYTGGQKLPRTETYKGIRISRSWSTSFGKRNIAGRMLDYLSFYIAAAWKLATIPRHDVILSLTTPPFITLLALIVGRLRKIRIIAVQQDLYPDVAVALGALRADSLLTRFLSWLDRKTLQHADRVIVLGECMRERVLRKSVDAAHIDVIPNWADGTATKPLPRQNWFSEKYQLSSSFVLLFAGNFGLVNDFATVLDAAKLLRDESRIVFLFVGGGVQSGLIDEFRTRHELSNIIVLPYHPPAVMPEVLAAADVALVTLADGLAGLSVPSKTYGSLAAGKPVLFVGDLRSDIARLVESRGCGAAVRAGDSLVLAEVIRNWASRREDVAAFGINARAVFEANFDRSHAVNSYVESMYRCVSG